MQDGFHGLLMMALPFLWKDDMRDTTKAVLCRVDIPKHVKLVIDIASKECPNTLSSASVDDLSYDDVLALFITDNTTEVRKEIEGEAAAHTGATTAMFSSCGSKADDAVVGHCGGVADPSSEEED